MTLLTRLMLLITLAVLPTLAVVGLHEAGRYEERTHDVHSSAQMQAQQLAAEFRSSIESGQQLLMAVSEMPAVLDRRRSDECDHLLARLHQRFPVFGALVATDENGIVRCGSGHGIDLSDRPHVRAARETRGFVVGETTVSLVSLQQIVPLAYPIIDETGRMAGVLVAGFRVDEFGRRLASYPLTPGATAVIADRRGTVVAHLPGQTGAVGQPMPDLRITGLAASQAGTSTMRGPEGELRVMGFEPPATDPWNAFYVGVALPQAALLGAGLDTRSELLAFLAALTFSAVSIAWIWRRTVACPVRQLLTTIERQRDDEAARVRLTIGSSELRRLGQAFDELLDRLHSRSRALAESEARARSMLERMRSAARAVHASASAIVIIDARRDEMPIVDVNPAFERMTGYTRDEAIRRNYRLLIGDDDTPALLELRRALLERRECTVQLIGARKDGSPFHCELRIAPVFEENGRVTHYVAVQNDISERVESELRLAAAKEEAEASNRAKTQFLANMSHELRTPLNAIIGFSEIIQNELFGPLLDRYKEYGTDINDAGRHLLALLNDLLDLARIEGGKMGLEVRPVPLAPLVEGCLDLVRPQAEARGVALQAEIEAGLTPTCDPTRLRQMLLNLLTNAIKFTPCDGNVTVSAHHDPASGFVLKVSDTGIGMAPAEIRVALEPFGQVENALSRQHDGVGLGLPIAKRLAELHGGSLSVASGTGSGTVITITLPPVIAA